MVTMRNASPYKELLRITEEVLQCLQKGDEKRLIPLLDERRGAFRNIHRGAGHLPRDAASWIRRIRDCEDQCTSLAREKKSQVHHQLEASQNRIRLGNSYHVTQSD